MLKKNLPLWAFKVAAGGNRNAAEVFKEIWHWAATAETVFNRPWTALSRARLQCATTFSLGQVKRALAFLRSSGFITSDQHLFKGRNVNHFTVTQKGCDAVEKAMSMEGGEPPEGITSEPPEGITSEPPEGSTSEPLLYTTSSPTSSSTKSSGDEPSAVAALSPEIDSNLAGEEGEGESSKLDAPQTDAKEPDMSMADNFKNEGWKAKSMKLLHKPDTPSYYGVVWREALNEAGRFCPTLETKDLKLLKRIADACQPVSGEKVIQYAVANWTKFTAQGKIDKAIGYPAPKMPDMEFLLRCIATAVTAVLTPTPPKQQEALMAISTEKSVQLSSPPVIAPPPPKQTLDEIFSDPDEE